MQITCRNQLQGFNVQKHGNIINTKAAGLQREVDVVLCNYDTCLFVVGQALIQNFTKVTWMLLASNMLSSFRIGCSRALILTCFWLWLSGGWVSGGWVGGFIIFPCLSLWACITEQLSPIPLLDKWWNMHTKSTKSVMTIGHVPLVSDVCNDGTDWVQWCAWCLVRQEPASSWISLRKKIGEAGGRDK